MKDCSVPIDELLCMVVWIRVEASCVSWRQDMGKFWIEGCPQRSLMFRGLDSQSCGSAAVCTEFAAILLDFLRIALRWPSAIFGQYASPQGICGGMSTLPGGHAE